MLQYFTYYSNYCNRDPFMRYRIRANFCKLLGWMTASLSDDHAVRSPRALCPLWSTYTTQTHGSVRDTLSTRSLPSLKHLHRSNTRVHERHSSPYCCWSLWWISTDGMPSPRLFGSGYAANHKPFLKRPSGCFQNVGKNVLTPEGSMLKTDMCKWVFGNYGFKKKTSSGHIWTAFYLRICTRRP